MRQPGPTVPRAMYDEARAWGFRPQTARVLQRLVDYLHGDLRDGDSSTLWIVERFQKLDLITPEGKLKMENPESATEWILIGLAWEGYIRRVNSREELAGR